MNDRIKATPGGTPPDPTSLAAKVGAAHVEPQDPTELRVRLDVEGGSINDRYEFHFDGTGAGDVQLAVTDRLRGMEIAPRVSQVTSRDMTAVLKDIDIDLFADITRQLPPIPPDSTVGILRVSDGEQEVSIAFMADEGQAETAGFELPPELSQAIDGIYAISAKQLEQKSVRP